MPRVKLNERMRQYEQEDRELVALIEKYLCLARMKKEDLAVRSGVNISTLYSRLRSPGEFRRAELRSIFNVLKVPKEEVASIKW